MTSAIATEVEHRKGGAPRRPRTLAAWFGAAFLATAATLGAADVSAHEERAKKYESDPVAYAHEVLGVETWSAQDDILKAMTAHRARVAVRSGQKVGKSKVAAFLALWFYDTHDDARVVVTAPTSRQVDTIFWREIKRHVRRSAQPIDGRIGELARTGLKADDQREIVGFTATEAESVAGVSGKNLLYIVDEASGVSREIFDAIEGNRASAAAKILLISNPTRTEGTFFDAFFSKKDLYTTITISAEKTPNVLEGREVIPGLASVEHIDEKKREYGEDSAWYKIRVKGEHALSEDGKILSVHQITEAQGRWSETEAKGRLQIGIDPAGAAGGGDESTFAIRRGQKILELVAMRGLSPDAHVAHAIGMLTSHRTQRDEPPVLAIDSEGAEGWDVYCAFRDHARKPEQNDFELYRVRSSMKAIRQPEIYERVRDELWGNLERWVRDGGALPEDSKLELELHAPQWEGQISGKRKATAKKDLRIALGRSPDRADAVALAVWAPSRYADESEAVEATPAATSPRERPAFAQSRRVPTMDPYAAANSWKGRR